MIAGHVIHGLVGAAAGAGAWTLTEYVTHRFVLHGRLAGNERTRGLVGGIHRNHHRDPEVTYPAARLAGHLAMAATGSGAALAASRVVPTVAAWAGGLSWSAGYSTYELVHWRFHHRPPSTAWGRRQRERHFRHHFGASSTNHGVTTTWWDRVFGTEASDTPVTVPRRHAPDWLGELGDGFRLVEPRP